jgi:hypothetical protein
VVAHVQRRGRGRAKDTRSILLAECGMIARREELNMLCEKMMAETLIQIDANIPRFRDQINEQILANQQQRDKDRLDQLERIEKMKSGKIYVMACRKCNNFLARSNQIFRAQGMHYVVVDETLWNRVSVNQYATADRPESGAPTVGKVHDDNVFKFKNPCSRSLAKVELKAVNAVLKLAPLLWFRVVPCCLSSDAKVFI